jgi:ferrochelatase
VAPGVIAAWGEGWPRLEGPRQALALARQLAAKKDPAQTKSPNRQAESTKRYYCQSTDATMAQPVAPSQPRFGFVSFAETWNGRLAMLGFVIGLATELLTGQGIVAQIGLG